MDPGMMALDLPHQRYPRRSLRSDWYDAPRNGYHGCLEVDESGFVRVYPNLWVAEERDSTT